MNEDDEYRDYEVAMAIGDLMEQLAKKCVDTAQQALEGKNNAPGILHGIEVQALIVDKFLDLVMETDPTLAHSSEMTERLNGHVADAYAAAKTIRRVCEDLYRQ